MSLVAEIAKAEGGGASCQVPPDARDHGWAEKASVASLLCAFATHNSNPLRLCASPSLPSILPPSAMSEATLFLKKKPRPGAPRPAGGAARSAAPRRRPPPPLKRGAAATGAAGGSADGKAEVKVEPKAEPDASNIVEIKILSAAPGSGLRYNIMKLNSLREADPSQIPAPILMNRKQPGPKQPPQFAFDEEGNIVGRFVYDPEGKPVLDDEGKQMIEKRDQPDMNLVGAAPGQTGKQRRGKRNLKEVFHQDVEVIRLRREEANPWVLEAKNPSEGNPVMPEHWVGRMQEPSTLPTVLLINEGTGPSFTMMPLGRQYRFEPERPFKVMDADQANKYVRSPGCMPQKLTDSV